MTCKHGSNNIICPYCDAETIEANTPQPVCIHGKTGTCSDCNSELSVKELVDQPAPKFTLVDLEHRLTDCYSNLLKVLQGQDSPSGVYISSEARIKDACGHLQELLAIVGRCKTDLESIDMPSQDNLIVQQTLNIDKPQFSVSGVQLIEQGRLTGTSLYTTVVKARIIRDILNKEFAKLKVNHEAKIVNYPVF